MVRMEMNLLPTRPLGTLYQLVGRPAKRLHLCYHTVSSSTPPERCVPLFGCIVSPNTSCSFRSVAVRMKLGRLAPSSATKFVPAPLPSAGLPSV
eukprot:2036367-Ditylum_brightwellii.AAC.2